MTQNLQEWTDVSNRTFYRLHIFIKHVLSEFQYFFVLDIHSLQTKTRRFEAN